jgi:hypothetical protein
MLPLCPPPPRASHNALCSRLLRSFQDDDASGGKKSSPVTPPFPMLGYDGVIAMPALKPRPSNAHHLPPLDRQRVMLAKGRLTPKQTDGTHILPVRPPPPRLCLTAPVCSLRATPSNGHLIPKWTDETHTLSVSPLPPRLSLKALDCNCASPSLSLSLSFDGTDASSGGSVERFHSGTGKTGQQKPFAPQAKLRHCHDDANLR